MAIAVQSASSLDWSINYPELEHSSETFRVSGSSRPSWFPAVENRLNYLGSLKNNWDGRGAVPVSPSSLYDAIRFLVLTMREDTPAPWIGPLNSGGLQLVWTGDDLEIEAIFDSASGERVLAITDDVEDREIPADHAEAAQLFAEAVRRLENNLTAV